MKMDLMMITVNFFTGVNTWCWSFETFWTLFNLLGGWNKTLRTKLRLFPFSLLFILLFFLYCCPGVWWSCVNWDFDCGEAGFLSFLQRAISLVFTAVSIPENMLLIFSAHFSFFPPWINQTIVFPLIMEKLLSSDLWP